MTDKAAEAVDQGRQAAGEVAHTAAEQVREVKDEAVKQARDLVGEARQHVVRQTSEQHRNLVDNLRSLGSELGSMADSGEGGTATELVSKARERVNGAAEWLDGREPGELLDEVRTFARQRPGVFLLGAVVAGVAVGRLTRGAIAVHTEDQSSTGGSAAAASAETSPFAANGDATLAPQSGFAHTTGQAGYEQGYGQPGASTPGYSTGGGYAQPGQGGQQGNEFGYGSPSYGNGGTAAYPTQPSGGPR